MRRCIAPWLATARLLLVASCGAVLEPAASSEPPAPIAASPAPDEPAEPPAAVPTPSEQRTPAEPRPITPAPIEPGRTDIAAAYDRAAWPLWIDTDGDCQDTRTEVLIVESEIPVTFTDARACEVAGGRWRCPYTDRTFTDPRALDIDHLVPLAHAHDAGGSAWDRARRQAFANALDDPEHLIAVDKGANRSKGARTIETWLPAEPGFRCEYMTAWRRIKHTWKLAETASERAAIDAALARCRSNDVPERPGATKPAAPPLGDEPGTCCRVCKSGKPCGDACISATKTCHKPRGCACAP